MPLRKIKEYEYTCMHPEHNPPMHIWLDAGTYEYTCPACGKKQIFVVQPPFWTGDNPSQFGSTGDPQPTEYTTSIFYFE